MLPVRYIAKIYGRGRASGVARILVRGVLRLVVICYLSAGAQLAGHRGREREGDVPPPAEGGRF